VTSIRESYEAKIAAAPAARTQRVTKRQQRFEEAVTEQWPFSVDEDTYHLRTAQEDPTSAKSSLNAFRFKPIETVSNGVFPSRTTEAQQMATRAVVSSATRKGRVAGEGLVAKSPTNSVHGC